MNLTADAMNTTEGFSLTSEAMSVLPNLLNMTLGTTDLTSIWSSSSSSSPSPSIPISTTVPPQVRSSGGHPLVRQHMVWSRPVSTPSVVDEWSIPPQEVLPAEAWKAFQVIHTLLTILALGVNCTSLGVIYGIVSKLTRPLQMLTSLAFADMLAPWAIMTMYFPTSSCQDEIHTALLITSHNAASLTLLVLAMCHNIATFRPLNYDKIVTQKRLWITINLIWIVAILGAHIHFLAVLTHHDPKLPFCIQVLHQTKMALSLSLAFLATTLIVSILIYARILLHLRPIRGLTSQEGSTPRRSTRGVITGIILVTAYLLAWLPYIMTKFVNVSPGLIRNRGILIGLNVCQVIILVVTILDPVVYACRMSCMQSGYLSLYHKLRAFCLVTWYRVTNHDHNDEMPSTPLNPIESIC